jgi:hypothetical protein
MQRLYELMTDSPRDAAPAALDVEAMIAEGEAMIADIEARRRARWERHAAARAQAREAYERANREHAARFSEPPPLSVAASLGWWDEPAPLSVW